jgi:hypothetical protein
MLLDQNAAVVKGLGYNLSQGIQFHPRDVAVLGKSLNLQFLALLLISTFILHHPL